VKRSEGIAMLVASIGIRSTHRLSGTSKRQSIDQRGDCFSTIERAAISLDKPAPRNVVDADPRSRIRDPGSTIHANTALAPRVS